MEQLPYSTLVPGEVAHSLHHKEILLSEPGRNRRECILTRNSPLGSES